MSLKGNGLENLNRDVRDFPVLLVLVVAIAAAAASFGIYSVLHHLANIAPQLLSNLGLITAFVGVLIAPISKGILRHRALKKVERGDGRSEIAAEGESFVRAVATPYSKPLLMVWSYADVWSMGVSLFGLGTSLAAWLV